MLVKTNYNQTNVNYLGNSKLKILLGDVDPSFSQSIHTSFCADTLNMNMAHTEANGLYQIELISCTMAF